LFTWLAYFIGDCGFVLIHISLTVGDVLGFYGSILAFLLTIALGALALWRNGKANKTNEKLPIDTLSQHIVSIIMLAGDNMLIVMFLCL